MVARIVIGALCCALAASPAQASGDPDPAFGGGTGYVLLPLGVGDGAYDSFQDMFVDSSGAIVATGYRGETGPEENLDIVVTRLLDDGTPDPGFGTAGTATIAFDLGASRYDQGTGVFETADGRYVACGIAETPYGFGGGGALAVVRLLASGARDTSFDLDGRRTLDVVHPEDGVVTGVVAGRCAAGPDGTIVLPGALYNSDLTASSALLVRLQADGSLDTTLDGDGVLVFDPLPDQASAALLFAVQVQADGSVVGAGIVHGGGLGLQYDMFAVRLLADGRLDPAFGDGGVRVIAFDQGGDNFDLATSLAVDRQGGVYLAGTVTTATSGLDIAMVHLLADGSLDPAFATGGRALFGFDFGGALEERGNDLAMDSAGRLYVAGVADVSPTDQALVVLRVTPTGLLDASYSTAGVFLSGGTSPPTDLEFGTALALDGLQRVVVAGNAKGPATSGTDALVLRLTGELVFASGFETVP